MGYIKCPRCELNYMLDTERYCAVCKREMRGEDEHEELELCSVCGENPVVPGEELCASCLKELHKQERIATDVEEDNNVPEETDVASLNATSELEEIEIDVGGEDDIPTSEYSEIHKELGGMEEEEEEEEEEKHEEKKNGKRS